jgi:hypothetical protein
MAADPVSEGVPEAHLNLPRGLILMGIRGENRAIVCGRAKEGAGRPAGSHVELMIGVIEVRMVQ